MSDATEDMRNFIDRWRADALAEPAHGSRNVAGKPVAFWLNTANATTEDFLAALAGDPSLIVPGRPADSRFLTTFLRPGRPMGDHLATDRGIVERWIAQGITATASLNSIEMTVVPFRQNLTPQEIQANEAIYFHQLMNIENYPEFLTDAKAIAQYYLDAPKPDLTASEYEPIEKLTTYKSADFDVTMKAIYDNLLVSMYNTHWFDTGVLNFEGKRYPIGRISDASIRVRILQSAPFNLVDGAWLQNITSVGPTDKIRANLASIWEDEAGNGVASQNHPNVYDALLRSQNIYLPPIKSREFIKEDFLPGAFTSPLFQLAIGQFPQAFFPELLGMTLYLEWEATPTLTSTARLYAGRGINPIFYALHVAIDNISEGHGALAREAIKLYLESVRDEGGEPAVQEHWKRIRNGYITWLTIGGLGIELIERTLMTERKQINVSDDPAVKKCWPDVKGYYEAQMVKLIERKAPYARDVHKGKSIGGRALSDLFDDPRALMAALVRDKWIDVDRPRDSRFLSLMEFNGPMYKVFTERDKDVVLDWIESLRVSDQTCIDPLPDGNPTSPLADQVREIIDGKAADAMTAHVGLTMRKSDGTEVPLATLFTNTVEVMSVLKSNGWIVPSDPERSMFYTRILGNGGPMSRVFTDSEKEVVRAWIAEGAQLPGEKLESVDWVSTMSVTDKARLDEAVRNVVDKAWPLRHVIGMGAVHCPCL